jgi:putative ABC transport system ATP-binding protein
MNAQFASAAVSNGGHSTDTLFYVDRVSRIFSVGRREVHALAEVSITVSRGEMILIEGKSGSGKTTLLNLLGGLDRASAGTILYKGRDIGTLSDRDLTRWRRQRIGFIFQAFALLPGLTAFENVDLAGRVAGLSPLESARQAFHYLDMVGLDKRALHRISELSGGEQQRVALSRGLVGGPEIVLADEPTGELDHAMSRKVLDVLRGLVDNHGLTVCLTSHDPAVRGYAHRVYTLEDGRMVREAMNT